MRTGSDLPGTTAATFECRESGLHGKPCQCTPAGRRRVTRDCSKVCSCHGLPHERCPRAQPCIGRCGRLTTASQTNAPGYCPHCAADRRWRKIA